jgi:arylsulfatase A-like enzyme
MSLDAQLKDFFAQLQSGGLLDNTIVVFVADHGEEFYEHVMVGHHQTLYEEVIRVPFLLSLPGQDNHAEISEPVSLLDVAPTLLDLAGLPAEETFEGRSLTGLLDGRDGWRSKLWGLFGAAETRPVFSELIKAKETVRRSPHERAVVLDHDKLIVGVEGEREYYDLAADPGEKNPQATSRRSDLDRALQQLYAGEAARGTPRKGTLDAETRERMRALGYDE